MHFASASPKSPSTKGISPAHLRFSWTDLSRRQDLNPHVLQAVRGWHEVRTRSRFDAARFLADHSSHLIFSSHFEAEPHPHPGRLERILQCYNLPGGVYVALINERGFGTRLLLWAPTPALAQETFAALRAKYALARKRQANAPVFLY